MRGYAAIGLVNTKKDVNVGGALRAVGCYGAAMIAISGARYRRQHSDTQATYRHVPLIHTDDLTAVIPFDCVPVAIELIDGAVSLPDYQHPERAFYVFGPEDGNVPSEILAKCRDVVSVPTRYCMNLAATVNVVLYDRLAKQIISGRTAVELADSAYAELEMDTAVDAIKSQAVRAVRAVSN